MSALFSGFGLATSLMVLIYCKFKFRVGDTTSFKNEIFDSSHFAQQLLNKGGVHRH